MFEISHQWLNQEIHAPVSGQPFVGSDVIYVCFFSSEHFGTWAEQSTILFGRAVNARQHSPFSCWSSHSVNKRCASTRNQCSHYQEICHACNLEIKFVLRNSKHRYADHQFSKIFKFSVNWKQSWSQLQRPNTLVKQRSKKPLCHSMQFHFRFSILFTGSVAYRVPGVSADSVMSSKYIAPFIF